MRSRSCCGDVDVVAVSSVFLNFFFNSLSNPLWKILPSLIKLFEIAFVTESVTELINRIHHRNQ